jgi:hypothetical protein
MMEDETGVRAGPDTGDKTLDALVTAHNAGMESLHSLLARDLEPPVEALLTVPLLLDRLMDAVKAIAGRAKAAGVSFSDIVLIEPPGREVVDEAMVRWFGSDLSGEEAPDGTDAA